jgi:hypothetical protein
MPLGLSIPRAGPAHHLDLPFCQACWRRVATSRRVVIVALAFAALTTLSGVALLWMTGSWAPFFVALGPALAVVVVAEAHARSARPKYVQLDRSTVVVDVPGIGRVVIVDTKSV